MNKIAIVGASGFVGRHLLSSVSGASDYRVKVLSRSNQLHDLPIEVQERIEIFRGDLSDPMSLNGFVEPGSTVINLAYLWGAGEIENLKITLNLLDACKAGAAKRLIHCSTAAVVGRVPGDRITEETHCNPVTEYGKTKLRMEETILNFSPGCFDVVILRPTSIFGPEGEPLKKLSNDLIIRNEIRNYLKSCLFGSRRMNLIHVANVTAAILFLLQYKEELNGGIFIVSDDYAPDNEFAQVENALRQSFGLGKYAFPRIPVPSFILRALLACLGRNSINPKAVFISDKLLALGYKNPVSFEVALAEYIQWYANAHVRKK